MNANSPKPKSRNTVTTGIIILGLGIIWLLNKLGVYIPHWLYGWEMLLIFIGVVIGIGNKFRNPASYILIAIGGIFLVNDLFFIPYQLRDLFWPALVIIIGLIILLKPRIREWRGVSQGGDAGGSHGADAKVDIVSIFNGVKRTVSTQDFRGGEAVNIFGGTEINLTHADIQEQAALEITAIFGGVKLIVPKNWEVRTEVTSIFGGVEDKRYGAVEVIPEQKILVVHGTVIFGGVDIVSY